MKALAVAFAAAASIVAFPSYANIVQDGDFEDGTGWTFINSSRVGTSAIQPQSESFAASTPCDGAACLEFAPGGSYFFQTLATTPGQTYDLSFYVVNNFLDTIPGGEQFRVRFGGQDLGVVDFSGTNWTQFTYSGLQAAGATTFLAFNGRNDFSQGGMFFDNIVVQASTAVPEPSTWALLIAGFGTISGMMRRRSHALRPGAA